MESQRESNEEPTLPPPARTDRAGFQENSAIDYSTLPLESDPSKPLSGNRDSEIGGNVRYFGDYELIGEIARGGMGVVYKARQVNLQRLVALKMILAGQLASPDDVQRFRVEAQAAASLTHPGIVPIFEVGQFQEQHYFSMGFVEGESLAERIKDGPLKPIEAASITKKIADAMSYAHQAGVIHRDLKPANVLLDSDGEPKITDFGLAKKVEQDSGLTRTGEVMGTPSFMPPEQALGKTSEVGPSSDIYSIGAVLYNLLTGRPPFQSANPLDTLMQVLDREPVAPSKLNPAVPLELETICLKCLEKQPQRRYESAASLADDLQAFIDGRPIKAKPVDSYERALKFARRQPVITIAICSVVILVSLLLYPLATLDREVLKAFQAAFLRSLLWLIILGLLLGVYLAQEFVYRIIALRFFAKRTWGETLSECGWRLLLSFTGLLPLFCVLMFVIQLCLNLSK